LPFLEFDLVPNPEVAVLHVLDEPDPELIFREGWVALEDVFVADQVKSNQSPDLTVGVVLA